MVARPDPWVDPTHGQIWFLLACQLVSLDDLLFLTSWSSLEYEMSQLTGDWQLLASHSSSVSCLTWVSSATLLILSAARRSASTLDSFNCCFRCLIMTWHQPTTKNLEYAMGWNEWILKDPKGQESSSFYVCWTHAWTSHMNLLIQYCFYERVLKLFRVFKQYVINDRMLTSSEHVRPLDSKGQLLNY